MADESSFPLTTKLALGSVALAIVVLAMKAVSAWLTGSIALYSDALESLVNVATAIVALFAVRLAGRPASAALPYGYHKVEYFSAVIIGVFIAVAALVIFRQAYDGFFSPHQFVADPIGLVISVGATVINAGWAWMLTRYGRRERSKSLTADGKHLWTDVVSPAAVLIGVMLAALTAYHKLDAILAALVGVMILWSGWEVMRDSVIGLMDVAVDPKKLARIKELISNSADGAIEAHDIRQGDLHRVPSRGTGRDDRGSRPRHLRSHRGKAARPARRRDGDHSRRAGREGQAFRHRGGLGVGWPTSCGSTQEFCGRCDEP